MLESSDIDGGSSVAVLTYLRQILDALDHAELVNLLLQYLLALPEPTRPRSPTALKRKSSLMLHTEPMNEDDRLNPALFNLIDLLQNSVTSKNPQTVISALKLTTVIVGRNHFYAVDTLLQTQISIHQDFKRTHGALNAEVEVYMSLAESLGGASGLDEAYDSHLKDALRLIESHGCSNKLLDLGVITGSTATKPLPSPVGPGEVAPHIIRRDDPFLGKLLNGLKTFFTNNVEVNLAITETFVTLLTCPHFGLEGWSAVEPKDYEYISVEVNGDVDPTRDARRRPTWQPEHAPALMLIFKELRDELDILKQRIQDLDGLIAARKQAFRLHAEIEEAMKATPPPKSNANRNSVQGMDVSSPTTNPLASAIQQRFLDAVSPSQSRSQSRGRPADVTSSPSPAGGGGFLSQYAPGLSSPPSTSRSRPRGGEAMVRQGSDTGVGADRNRVSEQQLLDDVMRAATEGRMKERIAFPVSRDTIEGLGLAEVDGEGASSADDEDVRHEEDVERSASLGHVLTNAVILQEFVLEITAIMQVRASMFGEVEFV
jgi:hypothetical protein